MVDEFQFGEVTQEITEQQPAPEPELPRVNPEKRRGAIAARVTPQDGDLQSAANAANAISPASGAAESLMGAVQKMAPTVPSETIARVVGELVTAASLDSDLLSLIRSPQGAVAAVRGLARVASLNLSLDPSYQHIWIIRRGQEITFQAGVGLGRLAIAEAGCRVVVGIVRDGEACHVDAIKGVVNQAPIDWGSKTQKKPVGGWALLFRGDELVGHVILTAADIERLKPKHRNQAWELWPERMIERSLVVRAAKLCPRRPDQGKLAAFVAELESESAEA